MKKKQLNILQMANQIVHGERQTTYGHPSINYERIAKMWSVVLGKEVTADEAALCMICVKIAREVNSPHLDNLVDIAGYAEVLHMIKEVRKSTSLSQ